MKSETIVVIPARSGSKRVAHKNIRPLGGISMLERAVKSALDAQITTEVYVDTDSQEYAEIAKTAGAQVPFLRDTHSDDMAPVSASTANFVKKLQIEKGKQYSTVVQLMVNCPFRTPLNIVQAIDAFFLKSHVFQISCFKFPMASTWWSHTKGELDSVAPVFPEKLTARSQDLEDVYFPSGAIWIANTAKLLEQNTFYGPDYAFKELPWIDAFDIDTEEEWDLAEILNRGMAPPIDNLR